MNGIHHAAVQVRDLAAAERFYAGTLGLPILKRWPAADGTERSLWVDVGGAAFLALERAAPSALPPAEQPFVDGHAGWHVVALRIDKATRADWEERLATAGVPIVHRTAYTLFLRDPDGNRLGLSHYPDPIDGPA
jgi:hypothetical protein